MCAKPSEGIGRKLSAAAAGCLGALAVLGAYTAGGWSQQTAAALEPATAQTVRLSGADLEKAFWVCDYTATEKGINATPIDLCSGVTEDLKNEKFEGDFDELLKWWRQNKVAAHESLREQERLTQPAANRVR